MSDARVWVHALAAVLPAGMGLFLAREYLGVAKAPSVFVVVCAILAALIVLTTRRNRPPRPLTAWTLAACLLFVTGTWLVARTPSVTRWQILHHQPILSPLIYFPWCEPVEDVLNALFESYAARSSGPASDGDTLEVESESRPHVVIVLIDALRADALGAWGVRGWTPHLDAFGQDGFVFQDVIANSSWTRSSVASLFTGRLPEEHGARDRSDGIAEGATTLAEKLGARGYETAAIISNFGAVSRGAGFQRGFSQFVHVRGDPYGRAEAVNEAVAAHLSRRSEAPQFVYVHYLDPHRPYKSGMDADPDSLIPPGYTAEVRYTDAAFGELVQILERSLGEEVVTLAVSDHGEAFGEHGRRGHGSNLYREALWIPVILRGLGTGKSHERLELRHFHDLVARVAAGHIVDPAAWGREVSPTHRYASIYLSTPTRWYRPYQKLVVARMIESRERTLIWSAFGPSQELYRANDPAQRVNVAAVEPQRVHEMSVRMARAVDFWMESGAVRPHEAELEKMRALGYIVRAHVRCQ